MTKRFIVFLTALLLAGCGLVYAVEPTPTATPEATATTEPGGEVPTATPSPEPGGELPPVDIEARCDSEQDAAQIGFPYTTGDHWEVVTAAQGLNLRREPGFNAEVTGYVAQNDLVRIAGPICVRDGYTWALVDRPASCDSMDYIIDWMALSSVNEDVFFTERIDPAFIDIGTICSAQ